MFKEFLPINKLSENYTLKFWNSSLADFQGMNSRIEMRSVSQQLYLDEDYSVNNRA